MIARGFAPAGRTAKGFPDANFLPICTGIRTLRPACDLIVSAVAANDMHRLEDIEEAVVELVKDSCRKLNDTNNKGKMVVPNPAIPPGQVVVHASLLPPGAPNQWGAATTIGNPGQLPPNPPLAKVPAGGQLGQASNVHAAQLNVPAAGQLTQAPPGAAGPNVPAAQVNVPTARQLGEAAPGADGPNVLLGARTPRQDLQGKVTLPSRTRTSKKKDNTPLEPRRWDGASSVAAWVVASQHQRPLSMEHIL